MFVIFPDIVKYFLGPLPKMVCTSMLTLRLAIITQAHVYMDSVLISRCVFIFWLKNPLGFQDEFWATFIRRWAWLYSIISQLIVDLSPGKERAYFYFCTGIKPPTEPIRFWKLANEQLTIVFTVICHVVLMTKIQIHQRKPCDSNAMTITETRNLNLQEDKTSLSDFKTTVFTIFFFSLLLLISLLLILLKQQSLIITHFICLNIILD